MSNFKVGIIVDGFRKDFKTGVEIAASLKADGIQMYMVKGELGPENVDAAKIREIKDILNTNGVAVSAVCGDLEGHGFTRANEIAHRIELSKRIMANAYEIGTKVVTTHIGVVPADKNHDRYKIMQEACSKLGEIADDMGMSFAIETGPEKAFVLKEFLDSLSSKGMKVNLDPANLVMVTGDDPVEAVYTLKDYIVHTHAKDGIMIKQTDPEVIYNFFAEGGIEDLRMSDYFLETPLGEGKVDFDRYLAALTDIGYNGYLTIERELGPDPEGDIRKAISFLRSKI